MREYNNNGDNNSNTGLVVAISIMSCVLVVVIVVAILLFAFVFSNDSNDGNIVEEPAVTATAEASNAEQPAPVKQPVPTAIPVGANMYIGNCNVSVTLRTGPGTATAEICQVGVGEMVYVIEYTTDEFAKVNYNGQTGYIMRKYVVSNRPQVWNYDETEVEWHVAGAVKAFVNGINTGDTTYAAAYYMGDALTEELQSRASIDAAVLSEEILSLNCHSVQRVSPSQVSCIRDSVIRVTYNDGTVKDITETYKYIVDLSTNSMKIVDIAAM